MILNTGSTEHNLFCQVVISRLKQKVRFLRMPDKLSQVKNFKAFHFLLVMSKELLIFPTVAMVGMRILQLTIVRGCKNRD